jgi:hypothetical protein
MLNKEAKVQGIAIYAEFRKPGETMQLLLTPDAYTTTGELMPMNLVRRVVTPETPKKQWRNSVLQNAPLRELLEKGVTNLADENKDEFAEMRMRHALTYFDRIVAGGWVIEQKPILLEMSKHDADDLAKGKTPNKLIYRIGISRKALGFRENLV